MHKLTNFASWEKSISHNAPETVDKNKPLSIEDIRVLD